MSERNGHYLTGLANQDQAPSFLQRWSERKQAVREAEDKPVPEAHSPVETPAEVAAPDKELPTLETLNANTDCSGFLSPEVDEALRKLALRKLFHMADFNVLDGLNEYDDDYTVFEGLGDVVPHNLKRWQEQAKALAENDANAESMVVESSTTTADAESDEATPPQAPLKEEPSV